MPGGDRTGPQGGGPKTGRCLGNCADSDQPGYMASRPVQGLGRGFHRGGRGRGFGQGRGGRAGFWSGGGRGAYVVSTGIQDQDIDSLKEQAEELGNALQELQARLSELEPEDEERK